MQQTKHFDFPAPQCFTGLNKVFAKLHLVIVQNDFDTFTLVGQSVNGEICYQLQATCTPEGKFNALVTVTATDVQLLTTHPTMLATQIESIFKELKLLLDPFAEGNYLERSTEPVGHKAKDGQSRMIGGFATLFAGLAMSYLSEVVATQTGGVSYLFYGIIVIGAVNFIAGMVTWLSYRKSEQTRL